jgi:hypothetical protein
VIDHFKKNYDNEALAFFYCNRNEESRREPGTILSTIIKQLCVTKDGSAIQEQLVNLYTHYRRIGSTTLTEKDLDSLLQASLEPYSRTTIILDALDECGPDERFYLIKIFSYLVKHVSGLKIFVSSRRDQDIRDRLEKEANISIEATDNQDDIARFVLDKIKDDEQRRRRPLSSSTKSAITQTLLDKSQGM